SRTSPGRWTQELLARNEYLATENRILKGVPRSLSIWAARSRVKDWRSVISAASSGATTKEMMPVAQAAPRERHGVGAILGGTEHVGFLAAAGDVITLQVGDMGGERRRAEGAAPMLDHPSLDDDAALGGEEPACDRTRSGRARTSIGHTAGHPCSRRPN